MPKEKSQKKTEPSRGSPRSKRELSSEYLEYLERYAETGGDRPRLEPEEFDQLDDELLDLLASESDRGELPDEQMVRLRELEYLLIEADS